MTQTFQWAMGGVRINQTTEVEKKMSSGGCAFSEKHWDGNERQKLSLHFTIPCLLMEKTAIAQFTPLRWEIGPARLVLSQMAAG